MSIAPAHADHSGSQTDAQPLFRPIHMGPYELPNRVLMAPLTRCRAGKANVPTALMATYYAQRATAGLIISEATQVAANGQGYPNTPGIHSSEQTEGWKQVTQAVHAAGGRIFLQLWHVGRVTHSSFMPHGELPIAPSAIKIGRGKVFTIKGMQEYETPRALASTEIPGIVEQYRQGAANALAAGFDGVEIHAANGYLIDQFLRDGTNHRTDAYGGSAENRVRLLREVAEACISVWGPDRVGVRVSPGGTFNDMRDSDPVHTFTTVAKAMHQLNVAYLHVVELGVGDLEHGGQRVPAKLFRPAYSGVIIGNGSYDFASGNESIATGNVDAVAFGHAYIANPDLVERFRRGAELNVPDQKTFYGGSERGYTDYPTLS